MRDSARETAEQTGSTIALGIERAEHDPLSVGDREELPGSAKGARGRRAYHAIRSKIISCDYKPGQKLKIGELAQEFTVGTGSVREALSRLVSEELVTCVDQRGFASAKLSALDLDDHMLVWCNIEALALRRSISGGGIEWEARLVAALHRYRSAFRGRDDLRRIDAQQRSALALFLDATISACRNRRLLDLQAKLSLQFDRYLNWTGLTDEILVSADEATELTELALAKHIEAVVGKLRTIISRTVNEIKARAPITQL